jgi:tRNA1Val (adenine37-N6)-methyltransferase
MNGLTNEQPFVFRQFEVQHHLCAHKVGFDGVLLGAWADIENDKHILDIGTGCGLLALMAAQRNASASISAIENHAPSAQQARYNFAHSAWSQQLQLIEADFLEHTFPTRFDHLVTNPPFYVDRIPAKGEGRNKARHFTREELVLFMARTTTCLATGGRFSIVLPWREWAGFKTILLDMGYWIKRSCMVYTRPIQEPERVLVECSLEKCENQASRLNIYDTGGKYSQEYIKLTNPFYLNIS